MIAGVDRQQYQELLQRTTGLTANQRLIVLTYAHLPTDRTGTVQRTASELAQLLGLSPTVFSRLRKQLIANEWLEQSGRLGSIRYYRLAPRVTGRDVVVPLRRLP